MTDFVPIIKFFFYYVSQLSQVREIRIIGAIIVTRCRREPKVDARGVSLAVKPKGLKSREKQRSAKHK